MLFTMSVHMSIISGGSRKISMSHERNNYINKEVNGIYLHEIMGFLGK